MGFAVEGSGRFGPGPPCRLSVFFIASAGSYKGGGCAPHLRYPGRWKIIEPMANDTGQLDTSIQIVTPENIAFRYYVAGPFRRLPAYLIDLLIRILIGLVLWWMLSLLTLVLGGIGFLAVGLGLSLMLWFVLEWFYGGLFETLWNGQTPGKRLMRIRVLSVDGRPINGLQAVLRNVLRVVDQQPVVFGLLGLFTTMLNDRYQRLGDLACGTMVVVEERHQFRQVLRFNHPEAIRLAGLVPAGFEPSRTLARALAMYVQRRMDFPVERRREIARHLGEPLQQRFDLPPGTDFDLLLCGLYHRTFVTDRIEEPAVRSGSPFREPDNPFAWLEEEPVGSGDAVPVPDRGNIE